MGILGQPRAAPLACSQRQSLDGSCVPRAGACEATEAQVLRHCVPRFHLRVGWSNGRLSYHQRRCTNGSDAQASLRYAPPAVLGPKTRWDRGLSALCRWTECEQTCSQPPPGSILSVGRPPMSAYGPLGPLEHMGTNSGAHGKSIGAGPWFMLLLGDFSAVGVYVFYSGASKLNQEHCVFSWCVWFICSIKDVSVQTRV